MLCNVRTRCAMCLCAAEYAYVLQSMCAV
uniref:Uncharacterized protein n=1 Tax=Anguilla anguilla TaxID=7936 RepID=A0A0E9RQW2_ANGAN